MPKVKKVSNSRSKAAAVSLLSSTVVDKNDDAEKGPDATQNLSRGQRKRMLKRDQYLRRETMVLSTLKLKKIEEQKGRIDGLDAIKDALSDTVKKSQQMSNDPTEELNDKSEAAKTNKAKKEIAQKELTHFNLVLQHPSFQSNPFATMQEHLRNSFVKQAEGLASVANDERIEAAKKVEEKKEARKERIRNAKYEKGRRGRKRRN
mmetsp:Transcript_14062/g.21056  ORF Transcript_14062/g.21056 Transcript_14062/m.21056 type:complete len:205 (+) Transcript_14062:94-708(+)